MLGIIEAADRLLVKFAVDEPIAARRDQKHRRQNQQSQKDDQLPR